MEEAQKTVPITLPPIATTPTPQNNRPTNEEFNIYEKLHYDKHLEFLKWSVGISGTFITLIVGVALYFTYNNVKDYKDEFKQNMGGIKSDIKEIKIESINTIHETKKEVDQQRDRLKDEINKEIPIIKEDAENLALNAVRKTISEEFESNNIRGLIERTADERLNSQVGTILENKIKSASKDIDEQTKAVATLSVALDQIRAGDRRWFMIVDSIKTNHPLSIIRELAFTLQNQKISDYGKSIEWYNKKTDNKVTLPTYGDLTYLKGFDSLLYSIVDIINTSLDLNKVAMAFKVLNKIADQQFKMFDFMSVKIWFKNDYIKNQKLIKEYFETQKFTFE